MTTTQTLLATSVFLTAAGVASAQPLVFVDPQTRVVSGNGIQVVSPVPPAPPVAPIQIVPPAPPAAPFHLELGVDFDRLMDQAAFAVQGVGQGLGQGFQRSFQFSQVESQYSQARSFIDRNQYDRALDPLDKVIAAKGERADGATYWKAYSLWKLGRRDEALSALSQMPKQFPESRWLRDARALEVEVKQSTGQAASTDAADDDIKLLALQGIMRTDPDAAFPVIEKMLAGSGNLRLKDRALFVLSQSRSDRARDIIAGVAKGNANPDLQLVAIRYLAQSNSPDAIATLAGLYRADQSTEIRKAIISALSARHENTTAINAQITIYRAERNPDLRRQIVNYLGNSRTPEAKAFLLEVVAGK